ncbi:S8 family peptidase [Rhodobacteraceae bacterium M382]|nr:S8 family peptidase [Rhodobacteraceae bacterium M382]
MSGLALEDEWDKVGLRLLSNDQDNTIILFSSTEELTEFREKLAAYEGPIPEGQASRRYSGFINRIESIDTLEPADRLGVRLQERGFTEVADFQDNETYVVDIELWDFAGQQARRRKAEEIGSFIEEREGVVFDTYVGPSLTIVRVEAQGHAIRPILSVPEVAMVDFPPQPDIEAQPIVQMALDDLPPVESVAEDAPVIAIVDSGINAHPLLGDALLASEAFPPELGIADVWGHGSRVGGAAVFGDLRDQIAAGRILKAARLISAKVITDTGQFYERRTLPSQMRIVFERLTETYGCRIFVISLGDDRPWFERGRVGPWAMTLDELARELDVLIFVSAGNRSPRGGNAVEQSVTQYPGYLLEQANRIYEPSGAANVVTVGALSHASGLAAHHHGDAHVRAITSGPLEPSPFTRAGPGAAEITKPDFVEMGGTMIFRAVTRSLQSAPQVAEAGIVTLNHDFVRQLFTSGRGTSFSAPILARKAATLLRRYPNASANLIRALLAGAASLPEEAERRLSGMDHADRYHIVGNGYVDPLKAAYSDDHRVVYIADDVLEIDKFAIYRVPIPAEFQTGGKRTIRVSLAFDPPVRRTRAEYLGTKMDFRLIRGCPADQVSDHFRSYTGEEGTHVEMRDRYNCKLMPGPNHRAGNTLQSAEVSFSRDTLEYGNEYYLVVRCAGGWADGEARQRFAVVVELEHQIGVQLYARLRPRVRI